jgi:hypothetical protein
MVKAGLLFVRRSIVETECTECHGQQAFWTEGSPDSVGDLLIPTPEIDFDGTVLIRCWQCNPPLERNKDGN